MSGMLYSRCNGRKYKVCKGCCPGGAYSKQLCFGISCCLGNVSEVRKCNATVPSVTGLASAWSGFYQATLANWIIYCADNYFKPIYDYLHRQLLLRKYLMADETRIQVLKEPERNPETDSFMWLFRSGEDGLPPIVLYHYTETRARYNAVDFLDGFSDGYLETDGYQGYNNLPSIRRCSCWAHTRRYFIDAVSKGKQYDYSNLAV